MKIVKIRKKPNNLTEEEVAAKNSKTLDKLEEQAIKAVHSAINEIKNSRKLQDDIRTGKKEITISVHDGHLLMKNNYCTYSYNGKEKTYRKGTQEQVILEHLVKAKVNDYNGKLSGERLSGILMDKCPLADDKGASTRTVVAARYRINKFFGAKLIESNGEGMYWIDTSLKNDGHFLNNRGKKVIKK